jgi:hypothetical protein
MGGSADGAQELDRPARLVTPVWLIALLLSLEAALLACAALVGLAQSTVSSTAQSGVLLIPLPTLLPTAGTVVNNGSTGPLPTPTPLPPVPTLTPSARAPTPTRSPAHTPTLTKATPVKTSTPGATPTQHSTVTPTAAPTTTDTPTPVSTDTPTPTPTDTAPATDTPTAMASD